MSRLTYRSTIIVVLAASVSACGGEEGTAKSEPPIVVVTPAPAPAPPPPPPVSTLKFKAAASFLESIDSFGMVVREKGAVVNETYMNGYDGVAARPIASGTKSFLCALAALAEAEGKFTIDTFASEAIVDWRTNGGAPDPNSKRLIRIRHLLSLTSGLSQSGAVGGNLNNIDSYSQGIHTPSASDPDVAAIYTPNNHQAAAAFFEYRTGGSKHPDGIVRGGIDPLNYLTANVFDRIGMRIGGWARDINGKPNFGGGASISAVEWSKFGQLMLNDGIWQGQRLVPAGLLARCGTFRTDAFLGYGLGFFLNRPVGSSYQPSLDRIEVLKAIDWDRGGKAAPSAPDDMYMAAGLGGYRLYIIPSRDLVIVRYGGRDPDGLESADNRFLGLLLGSQT